MITRLFLWLFWPCRHVWDIIGRGPVRCEGWTTGSYYHLRCKKCGDVKSREFNPMIRPALAISST